MKKIISIILSIALIFSIGAFGTAYAADSNCTCTNTPIIFVSGFGDYLYMDEGTPDQRIAFNANAEELIENLLAAVPSIALSVALQQWDLAADKIIALLYDIFGELACDENGDSIYNVSNTPDSLNGQVHKYSQRYYFYYDWRLDPMDSAEKLNAYINEVRENTGHDKVVLEALSEGGIIANAYLQTYGYDKIDTLFLSISANKGLTLVGELFNKNVCFDSEGISNFVASMVPSEGVFSFVSPLVQILDKTGSLGFVLKLFDKVLEETGDRLYDEASIPLAVQWPAIWGFVPDEYYESAKQAMLKGDPKYNNFIARIDNYHYNVANKSDDLLKEMDEAGVKIAIVSGYNYAAIPLTNNADYHCDALIDTALSSNGATCAKYGENLPADYKQKNDDGHNHISPDKIIDASTCVLPDKTWFIKDFAHQYELEYDGLLRFVMNSDSDVNVYSDERYPQFLQAKGRSIVPLEDTDPIKQVTLCSAVINLVKALFTLLVDWIKTIK